MVTLSLVRKPALLAFVIGLLLIQPLNLRAITSAEAKQDWYEARQASRDAQEAYRKANIDYAASKTEVNNQNVIKTGKLALLAALDEVKAWLIWKECEVNENPEIPAELKQRIKLDVEANLGKIDALRDEVNAIQTRLQLATTFLRMVGKYFELVADVARNTGLVWAHLADTYADKIEEYEAEIRKQAAELNKSDIIQKLDQVKANLKSARDNIDLAEAEYNLVVIPGNPILRFANGNQYLRICRNNLIAAHMKLKEAYRLLMGTS